MKKTLCFTFALLVFHAFNFAQITATPASICPGQQVVLSIPAQPGTPTYQWQTAPASTGPFTDIVGQVTATLTTNLPGWYQVVLNGDPLQIIGPIELVNSPKPIVAFTSTPSNVCATEPVQFSNNSSAGTYQWDFGNPASGANNTSTLANPLHRFIPTPGNGTQTFAVKLVVTNAGGCKDSLTQNVTMNQLPDPKLGGTGAIVYNGLNFFRICGTTSGIFSFSNTSTTIATNTNYQIIWGDATADLNSPTFTTTTHSYSLGTHTLVLIVTGQNGCKDTATYYVFVGTNPAVGLNNPGNTSVCINNALTFPITGTGSNTPGTTYTVTFNDGSAPIVLSHPPPADITHTFLNSSCGTTSSGYANSFSGTIQASNACASSSAIVVPIYVSKKSNPLFSVAPGDTVCVGKTVTFTNTTLFNVDNQNGVCNFGLAVWKITPATGWTLISGALGNDFGSNDVGLWTPGSTTLNINFTVPGTYSIKLKIGNSVCGNDSITKTICVNPAPLAAFDIDNIAGCTPLVVNTINNSNTPICGTNTYQWSVNFVPNASCLQQTPNYIFINGTSATSANPQFQFNSPGVYTIGLVTTSSNGICASPIVTKIVTVKGKPKVTMGTWSATICQNTSISPTATATCFIDAATTYLWSFPGGTPATSTAAVPGPITYTTPGTFTVTLTVTNECGFTTVTKDVTVNEVPIATVPGAIEVCPGTSIGPLTFTSTLAGSTFTWTNSNTAIGLAATGTGATIPAFAATNITAVQISATITVTVTRNGCSSSNSFIIKVNPTPAAPIVVTPINYCTGAIAAPLTATALPGHVLLWYTTATGGVGSTVAPTPSTATPGTTDYYVSQQSAATCEGPRSMIRVIVNAVPAITALFTNPTACGSATGTITISGLNTLTAYLVSYQKNSGTPIVSTITSTAAGTIVITGLTAGSYSNIFVTLLGCPSNIMGPFVLTDPSAPSAPTAGNNGPICTGTTLLLSASAITGATYNWTGPNSFLSAAQNPFITGTTLLHAGIYTVTATVSGCTSLPATTTVVINPTPALPTMTNNGPLCEGSTILLTANSTAGVSYAWTGPNGFTDATQTPSIPNATVAASGVYTVVVTLGTCINTNTTTVLVKPTPNISGSSAVDPASCSSATGSIILNGLAANTTYTVTYLKNAIPVSANLTSNAAGVVTIINLTAGTYSNIMAALTGCPSNMVGPFTLSDPTPPASPVAGYNGPLCTTKTLNLSASTIVGASYSWTGPGGFNSIQQNPTINNITLANAGTYSVTATVTGCTSSPATVTVIINPSPVISSTTSNSPVCTGNTLSLTTSSPTPGALSYLWTGPNAFTNTNANTTIPNVTGAAAGKYYMLVTLGSCSTLDSTTVVINATPSIIDSSKTDPLSCSSPTGTIILKGLVPNAVYLVSYTKAPAAPITISLPADAAGKIIIPALSAGTYSNIFVSLNNCPSLPVGPFTLNDPSPPVTPIATSNGPVCSGTTLTLNATTSSVGTALYSWTGPNGFTSSSQSPSITNVSTAANGNYFVSVTINNCGSSPGSLPVVVYPLPVVPVVSTPVTYCINTVAVPLTATVTTPGNTLLWYTTATGGVGAAVAPTPSTAVAGNTDYYVSQKSVVGCEGPRTMIRVTVNPDAKAIFIPTATIACPAFQITPAVVGLQQFTSNSIYNWYANNIFIGAGIIFPGYTIVNENDSVTIKLVTISTFGCKADSISKKFYTYKLPHPSFTKNIAAGCGPLTVQFTNTTPFINDFTYSWDFGNGQTSTLVQPGPVTFQPNPTFGDTTYVIKLKISTVCDTVIYKDSVLVHSKPKALYTPNNVNGCSPMKVRFTNTSLGIGNTYHWDFDDGQTFTTTLTDTFTHTFFTGVIDTFHVKLIVTNNCGSDSITYIIIAAPNNIHLNFSMNGTSQYGCAPHTVAFYNNSIGAGSFVWNFGDGNTTTTTKNIDTVYHTYNLPGAFTVSVTAINNCTDTTAQTFVTVYAKPVPGFTASNFQPCIGQAVQFTDNSTGASSRQWNFGDGNFSSAVNPLHSYALPGLYNVKLIVYNSNPSGNVCSDSLTRQVQVVATLPGNISFSGINSTCAPFTVTFANLTLPSVITSWDFGDGFTGTGDNIIHTYTQGGTFNVHVTVTVPGGCVYTTDKIITVGGPAGTLQYAPGFTCYPLPVFLQASATNTTSYFWDFGDGNTQTTTSSSVNHLYINPGKYVPTVTFLGGQGCTVLVKGIDTIKIDKIIAGFTTAQSGTCGNTTVAFTDTSHAYFGKALIKWDFGDGQSGTGFNVVHAYAASGNYVIEQIVRGISGCSDTIHRTISVFVKQKPVALVIGPATKCAEQPVSFTANITSVDSVNIIAWKLSNGATGTGPVFTYNFTFPGNYSLQLIAGTIYGCFDTTYHNITIKPIPVITASGDITLCRGNSANLSVTGNAVTYQWSPLQGLSCTVCTNPTASPLITTPYIVAGTNAVGCTVYDTVIVTVIQPMNLQVAGNDSICIGQSTLLQASGAATYIWSPAVGLSSTTISNPVASPVNTTIYRVIGYDGHNCYSDTAFITVAIGKYPTVSLGTDLTLAAGTQYPLKTLVVNGPITQWLWTPSNDLNCSSCPLPVANIKKDISYMVKVTTAYGCSAADTINIKVFCSQSQVFIANGFTPDGDGINDVLTVRGTGIAMVKHFRIFNRWGVVVFERDNFPPNNTAYAWDGKVKGKEVPPDIFVYTAEVICENGNSFTYKGNISLIK
jgi:gliding motility-associated-like protein